MFTISIKNDILNTTRVHEVWFMHEPRDLRLEVFILKKENRIELYVSDWMKKNLDALALHQDTTRAEVIRSAILNYLNMKGFLKR